MAEHKFIQLAWNSLEERMMALDDQGWVWIAGCYENDDEVDVWRPYDIDHGPFNFLFQDEE